MPIDTKLPVVFRGVSRYDRLWYRVLDMCQIRDNSVSNSRQLGIGKRRANEQFLECRQEGHLSGGIWIYPKGGTCRTSDTL